MILKFNRSFQKSCSLIILLICTACSNKMDSWKYHQPLRVEEKDGIGAEHFPVSFEMNTKRLIEAGKMRVDGADIRITAAGNQVPFQINEINTDRTLIIFPVDLKVKEVRNDIVLHYGNPSAKPPKYNSHLKSIRSRGENKGNKHLRIWLSYRQRQDTTKKLLIFQTEYTIPSPVQHKSSHEGILNIATCQFPVSGNIRQNGFHIRQQIREAMKKGADVAHFPEYALCGYAGKDFESWDDFDWNLLKSESEEICRLAAEEKIWVIFGSAHRLTGKHLPHNCLYVINDQGHIVERYDKRFCSFRELDKFSPGDHFSVFNINGVQCGLLICADSRYPELYREYKRIGVDCILHSFHIARSPGPNILTRVMPATIQTRAATNYLWISAPNSSAYYQTFPSIFVQPDGALVDSLKRNVVGIMVNEVNVHKKLYDASGPFRNRAMSGSLHSGYLVRDVRSSNRNEF